VEWVILCTVIRGMVARRVTVGHWSSQKVNVVLVTVFRVWCNMVWCQNEEGYTSNGKFYYSQIICSIL